MSPPADPSKKTLQKRLREALMLSKRGGAATQQQPVVSRRMSTLVPEVDNFAGHHQDTPLPIACATQASLETAFSLPGTSQVRSQRSFTSLEHAIIKGAPLEAVLYLVEMNAHSTLQPDTQFSSTLLHLACQHNARSCVFNFLLESHEWMCASHDRYHNLPLHILCASREVAWGRLVKVATVFPSALAMTNRDLDTPLHILLRRSGEKLPQALLQSVVKLNLNVLSVRDRCGNTPLHILCQNGNLSHFAMIRFLVEQFPEALTQENMYQETPLHLACVTSPRSSISQLVQPTLTLPIIRYLVRACPAALARTNSYLETPLHLLCQHGASYDVLELVLQEFPAACLFSIFYLDLSLHTLYDDEEYRHIFVKYANAALSQENEESSLLRQASKDAYVALLQALEYDAFGPQPPKSLVSRATDSLVQPAGRARTRADHHALLQWKVRVSAWIRQKENYDMINGIFRLNRAGRSYIFEDAANLSIGIQVLVTVKDNLGCLFLHLRENPLLCRR